MPYGMQYKMICHVILSEAKDLLFPASVRLFAAIASTKA
jgi:hypothetical protein